MADQNPQPQKTDSFQEWATRATAVLAVVAALSSGRWGASNLQAILEQGKVNDTWAYYQAKSMKQHEAEQTRDLARALAPGEPAGRAKTLTDLADRMEAEAKREEHDKRESESDAHSFEQRRDHLVESSFWFELSFGALQLGVILATISAAARRKFLLTSAVATGALGLLLLVNGLYHFVSAPRSWYQSVGEQMAYHGVPATAPSDVGK